MKRFVASVIFFLVASTGVVAAQALEPPSGEVVLMVSGDIAVTNSDEAALFDLEMLSALPVVRFTTSTIWTEGENTFEGAPLSELLRAVGANGGTLRATAINDYAIEIPVPELQDDVPIVAYRMNGEPMSRRQKGPLWIVYPYDSDARYRSEIVYSRSIWQLDRLEVTK